MPKPQCGFRKSLSAGLEILHINHPLKWSTLWDSNAMIKYKNRLLPGHSTAYTVRIKGLVCLHGLKFSLR
jgi:hypothetical protein